MKPCSTRGGGGAGGGLGGGGGGGGCGRVAALLITQCWLSSLVRVALRKSFVIRVRLLWRGILIRGVPERGAERDAVAAVTSVIKYLTNVHRDLTPMMNSVQSCSYMFLHVYYDL